MSAETLYAIVDIETTGGSPERSGITDVAIILHDGEKIIHRYEQLINPQRFIPRNITLLTGITNDMVALQPTFEEEAYTIYELLKDAIFVAHNVNFDYTFIKHHLALSGYHWEAKKFCTVRNARKYLPGYSSYSLGNICASLDIPIENRHRAMGDAAATVILFEKILAAAKQQEKFTIPAKEIVLPPHINYDIIEKIPETFGVYFFHDATRKIVYVGKANNIRKRVLSHFTGMKTTAQRQHFLRTIHDISYEETGSELMSLLLECHYIKTHWPLFNRAFKQQEPKYGLIIYDDINGMKRLSVNLVPKNAKPFLLFDTKSTAVSRVLQLIHTYHISMKYCKIFDQSYEHVLSAEENHNDAVDTMMREISTEREDYAVKLKGRTSDEQLILFVIHNQLKGYQYIYVEDEIDIESLYDTWKPIKSNHYMMQLIRKHITVHPGSCIKLKEYINLL